jgi:cytochrome c peroxidase
MNVPLPHVPAILAMVILSGPVIAETLELSIQPVAGENRITPETTLVNRAGERWSVTRLSYLLSEPALRRPDGNWHTCESAPAWMSLADGRHVWKITPVPEGEWTEIRFSVGLPPALNDRDPAGWGPAHPLNPNLNGLHWSWQGGYIFLALEGRFWRNGDDQSKAPGFAYHLARESFRTTVSVPVKFLTRGETDDRVALDLDLARIIDGQTSVSFARDGSSTHSKEGDPLAAALHANLKNAFREAAPGDLSKETRASPKPASERLAPVNGVLPPPAFPRPNLPQDLEATPARLELGRRLFHETLLSRSNSLSCASCHLADHGLSDPRPLSAGEQGRTGRRNAMPLFNLAWKPSFFWDGRAATLREQVLIPIEDHQELDEDLANVVTKLEADAAYDDGFAEAFGGPGISADRLAIALETFLLSLVSHDSKFDRAQRGEATLTNLEQRGFELFMTEREPRSGQFGGDCFHCHGGALFTDHQFRNNGLLIDAADPGRGEVTGLALDQGTFSTPSLRNIALTAPYMHDGRFATLEEVLDHYSTGVQRTRTLDPNLAKHPDGGLGLSPEEKTALIAFLRTLTDDQFAKDAYAEED